LRTLTKDPLVLTVLGEVLGTSEAAQVRQYAAILLRRRIMKKKQWNAVSSEIHNGIKDNILLLLVKENEKTVRKAIAELVGTVAKHDLSTSGWPAFFNFVTEHIQSQDVTKRELGMFVLSIATSVAGQQFQPHLVALLTLCEQALEDTVNHIVPFYSIQTLTCMAIFISSAEANQFKKMMPKIMLIVNQLIGVDEDLAVDAMEIFDELAECEVTLITPFVQDIIRFCLQIASNKGLGHPLRIKAMSFISWLIRIKKKAVMKQQLELPILEALFMIITEPSEDDDEDEEEFEDAEASTAPAYAAQTVDVLALHLPPEKLLPPLMKLVEESIVNADPNLRKAALLSLAVVSEGCSDHIRHKYLDKFLTIVTSSVSDAVQTVQNAALFALGQFSEYLQPDISKHSSTLLPLIFAHMAKASAEIDKNPRGLTKSYYALEMFVENLGKDILPYLDTLIKQILLALTTATTTHAKELAISAIGAIANAACEEIVPYFQEIINQLKLFLSPTTDEDQLKIQMQALDTLGVLARQMGSHFEPLAMDCLNLGLSLLRECNDPDLKRCIYSLFGALSTLMKENMQPALEEIIGDIMASLKSTEGIESHSNDPATEMLKIFDDDECNEENIDEMNDDEDEGDDDMDEVTITNSYIGLKEDGCLALGELATNCGAAFNSYVESSFTAIMFFIEHPASDLRKGVLASLAQICIAVFNNGKITEDSNLLGNCKSMLETTLPHIMKIIREDTDRHVAMAGLESLTILLEKIGSPIMEICSVDELMACIRDVMQQKMACQDEEDADAELDDQLAEYDALLIEGAGDVLPAVAKSIGGEAFAPYLVALLPDLLKLLKPSSPTADKSFAVGTLAESVHAIGSTASAFVQSLYPIFMNMSKDEDEEVRSNAIYGLGVLAHNGGEAMTPNYADVLKNLSELMSKEKNGRVIDNICAALCRMIVTNAPAIQDLDTIINFIITNCQLKEDFEECKTVFGCIFHLYSLGNTIIIARLAEVLTAITHIVGNKELEQECRLLLITLVQAIHQGYPESYKLVYNNENVNSSQLDMCINYAIN